MVFDAVSPEPRFGDSAMIIGACREEADIMPLIVPTVDSGNCFYDGLGCLHLLWVLIVHVLTDNPIDVDHHDLAFVAHMHGQRSR